MSSAIGFTARAIVDLKRINRATSAFHGDYEERARKREAGARAPALGAHDSSGSRSSNPSWSTSWLTWSSSTSSSVGSS